MKFYTLTFNANLPTKNQLNIPTNTDYKIGVKVVRNGELLDLDPADVTLGSLSADADKTNGYVTFTAAAGDDASYTQKSLVVDSESADLKFDLVENIFKSQQGELDAVGDTVDTFTREQLSVMFAPLKDTSTGAAKKASKILSGDVVASLFNVAVELYGEPVIPTFTLVKYTASSGLPNWEGDIVGELTNSSIPNKSDIAEVEIGSAVTSIGANAFSDCTNLTSVTIPDSVTSIEGAAFYNCRGLTSVVIPESVTSIGVDAFVGCNNILTVEFNGNAPAVGDFAFDGVAYGCKALVSSTATGFPAEGETWNGLVVEYK